MFKYLENYPYTRDKDSAKLAIVEKQASKAIHFSNFLTLDAYEFGSYNMFTSHTNKCIYAQGRIQDLKLGVARKWIGKFEKRGGGEYYIYFKFDYFL